MAAWAAKAAAERRWQRQRQMTAGMRGWWQRRQRGRGRRWRSVGGDNGGGGRRRRRSVGGNDGGRQWRRTVGGPQPHLPSPPLPPSSLLTASPNSQHHTVIGICIGYLFRGNPEKTEIMCSGGGSGQWRRRTVGGGGFDVILL